MAKKYLSLEEAATTAGMSTDEIKRLREQGELRGFADRGNWKFREEDIEELIRRRQPDSSPDVPMYDEDVDAEGSSVVLADEDASVGDQPTIVRGGASDSDVRLVLDESLTKSSDPDVDLVGDSDSDVRLVSDSAAKKPAANDSDSDVKLAGSDSDVQLLPEDREGGSDSDVRLVKKPLSGVRNTSDSGVRAMPSEGSGIHVDLDETGEASVLESGEVPTGEDSSFALASESGISLESLADSGISLEGTDSGIALQHLADSGISLADDEDDDSITLATEGGAGKRRRDQQHTMPMLDTSKLDLERDDTAMEVPVMAEDSEFELTEKTGTSSETNVIMFDEDDLEQTPRQGSKVAAADDDFGADELEVDEEFVSEEEELDVFDAADADFEDDFEEGGSQSDFVPAGGMARMAAPADADWGTGTFVGLAAATLLMSICGIVMFDLVRYMWHFGDPNTFNSFLLDSIGGMM